MKKHTLKRCAAVLAACTVMASAMPVVSMTANAATNLISNSTFESGTSGWGTYKESGGKCSLGTKDGKLALTVSNVGKLNYAVQVFYDIVPLYQNGVYRLKYDISCTTDRFIEGMIQMNGGDYRAYTWKGISLTSEPQTVDYEFTMDDETDIMAKLVFNCGIQEKYEGELPEHTIFIDNVSLELVDDSKVDYNSNRPYAPSININQVGYRPEGIKTAVFRDVTDQTEFSVVNADTKEKVFTGKLENKKDNASAGETNYTGDFSSVTEAGKYYISCDGLDNSYTFEIGDKVYTNLIDDSVRMLYLQRCGVKVEDSEFGHAACHTDMATVYGTNNKIDVSGGWHDAGDYGRYVVPAAKAVADLLYAYQAAPELYSDSIGIPESGNGTPDILDEARFELEWMLKMQAPDGGAYHKVSCASFPAYVMPTAETAELIVTPVSSTATADFCASMALAAEFYEKYDKDFAKKCMDAANKSWAWLEANPNFLFKNPEDIVTGEYGDMTDKDESYWAAVQMYRATKDEKYLASASQAKTGLDWSTVGDYGNIAILTMNGADKASSVYTNAKDAVIKQADKLAGNASSSPYGSALTKYDWGSNMTIANAGIICGLAQQLTGNDSYSKAAQEQLNYLLGVNPVATCFVSGYGTVSPENPHHRPSMAVGHAMKGMLAGGVNQSLEDSAAKAYCNGLPAAKCYIDNSESYSTNEITIYWNSPLTYLLSLTDKSAGAKNDEPETTTTTTTTETTTTTTTTSETTTTTTETTTSSTSSSSETSTESTTTVTETSSTSSQESTTTTSSQNTPSVTLAGDANCDGTVSIADAVLIMQSIANPSKFGLSGSDETHITAQGSANGDVNGNGNGITNLDALTIQKYMLNLISKLPE
ncbi:MAG: glycoside hydrolase family 9 protein [Ruminococcus sp.]|nr:glycoside hydrolase family 9 protein [Ruminococcus sp.]